MGIVITQAGVDVRRAADYQMVFNSDWPSLQIAFEALVTVTAGTPVSVPHGLKMYPLTMAWAIVGGRSIGRVFAQSGNLSGPQTDVSMAIDDTNIILTNAGAYNASYDVSIKCYNLDLTKAVDYTNPRPPVLKRPYDPTCGIKVTKYGKSMASTDLRDYILHSRAQSPAVLSVVTEQDASHRIGYNNPVNYVPWVLAFVGGPGQHQPYTPLAPGAQQSGYRFGIQSAAAAASFGLPQNYISTLGVLSYPNASFGSLVVLRDPLVVANTRMVTY